MASFEDYELVWYFLDATCVTLRSSYEIKRIHCPVDIVAVQSGSVTTTTLSIRTLDIKAQNVNSVGLYQNISLN